MDTIKFLTDDGTETAEAYVLEQTVLGGRTYLLVTDEPEGDGEAWILEDISNTEDSEAVYREIEDEAVFDAVAAVFAQMLDDVDLT